MSSRKKGKASLEVKRESLTDLKNKKDTDKKRKYLDLSVLETRKLFVKKVDDHCAEYEAGEYRKKACNACKREDKGHLSHPYRKTGQNI